ncbi:Aminoglycoside 3'-phosphotransferase [Chlamydia abortus]|nr:Aminoglycoside 3'-phosphotransferase [Chlamydia abortus]
MIIGNDKYTLGRTGHLIKKDAPSLDLAAQIVGEYLNSTAFKIERVLSGVSTYVYRIRLGEETLYLRVLPEQERSLGVEVHVHSLVRRMGVQVPEVIHFEHHNEVLGMSVMLVKEIPGSSVEDCISNGEYEDILYQAGQQIAVIHQVKVDGFGWIIRDQEQYGNSLRGEKKTLQDYICPYLEEDLFLLSQKVFSKVETSQITDIINSGMELMSGHEAHLVHGDFDDSHIFQQAGKYTGIIDFGEIQGSSPLYDLGHFKLHDGQRYYGFDSLAKRYDAVTSLSYYDLLEIDLWALWIGVRRLGMICGRTWGCYHEHLIKTVTMEMELLKNKLKL